MHEGSIAQNLLAIALEKAKEYKANTITLIRIKFLKSKKRILNVQNVIAWR